MARENFEKRLSYFILVLTTEFMESFPHFCYHIALEYHKPVSSPSSPSLYQDTFGRMTGQVLKTEEVCTHNTGRISEITDGSTEGATFLYVGLVNRTPPSYSRLNLYITISPDMCRPSTNAFQELPVTVDWPTLFP